MLPLVTAFWN